MSIIVGEIERERLLVRVYGIAVRVAQSRLRRYALGTEPAEEYANEFVARLLKGERAAELATMTEDEISNVVFRGISIAFNRKPYQRRTHVSLSEWDAGLDMDVAEKAERAERLQQIRDALAKLRPTNAAILIARYVDGMSLDAMAKHFGIPGTAIGERVQRATARLRKRLIRAGVEVPREKDELVTLAEAVKMMEVGPRNIQKWVKRGKLERFPDGQSGRYSRRQLELIRVDRRSQRSTHFRSATTAP